jgi:hypothetical protein
LHSLSVNVEMNLLSLVSPWLDKFCQITTKSATGTFPKKKFTSVSFYIYRQHRHSLTHWRSPEREMAGGWAAVLRGCAAATEAAVGEPALLLVDVAAALLRGCAAARRTSEGAGRRRGGVEACCRRRRRRSDWHWGFFG